jgi:hypothetical protein
MGDYYAYIFKAMKPYMDIAEKTKAEAMNVFEKGFMG